MPTYFSRRKPPSKLRCLKHLRWSVIALAVMLVYTHIIAAVCGLFGSLTGQRQCLPADMPIPLAMVLVGMFVCGLVACGYRAHRDFYSGDLMWDFPDR
jgi:purine-cytosine permease-like protein